MANVLKREEKHRQSNASNMPLAIPLPAEPVAVGYTWSVPSDVEVILHGGATRKIQTRQKFVLEKVVGGLATISVETQVLTPLNDPAIEAQLVQRFTNGTLRFDMEQGRVVSQQLDLDREGGRFQRHVEQHALFDPVHRRVADRQQPGGLQEAAEASRRPPGRAEARRPPPLRTATATAPSRGPGRRSGKGDLMTPRRAECTAAERPSGTLSISRRTIVSESERVFAVRRGSASQATAPRRKSASQRLRSQLMSASSRCIVMGCPARLTPVIRLLAASVLRAMIFEVIGRHRTQRWKLPLDCQMCGGCSGTLAEHITSCSMDRFRLSTALGCRRRSGTIWKTRSWPASSG